jgi:hypothetical protein
MRRTVLTLVVALALLAPAAATAQTAAEGYGSAPGVQVAGSGGAGNLPFTGLNATLVAAAGLLLLGIGLVVRKASRGAR